MWKMYTQKNKAIPNSCLIDIPANSLPTIPDHFKRSP